MKDVNATVIVDLKVSEEEIFNRLQKDARWGVKKAQKSGLIVEESRDFEIFYPIYEKMMKELGVKAETIEHVRENSSVLFLCKKDNKIIGGAVLHIKDSIPKLTRAASLIEYRPMQPNNLLYWHCIMWSKKRGFEKLDLGGWQINARGQIEGVNKFKERWGEVVYFSKGYPLHKAIGRKLIRNVGIFRWLNDKIKGRR